VLRKQILSLIAGTVVFAGFDLEGATSDDLWATAILLSSDPSTTAEETERLYLEAVKAASHKAPILVSLGDYFGGVMPMHQVVNDWMAETIADVEPEIEEITKDLVADGGEPSEAKIEEAAEKLWAEIQDSMMGTGVEIVGGLEKNKSKALRYYLAAVSSDPGHALGWYRVAMSRDAEDELRAKARQQLKAAAPDNALPYYLEALALADANKPLDALNAIQEGNRWRVRTLAGALPRNYQLRFPDTEANREAELAGYFVPPIVLRLVAMSNESMISMGHTTRYLSIAEQLLKGIDGQNDSTADRHEIGSAKTVGQMGINLANHVGSNDEMDGSLTLIGLKVAKMAADQLRTLIPAEDAGGIQDRIDQFEIARKRFIQDYRSSLQSGYDLDSDGKGIEAFEKVRRYLREHSETVSRLLKATGLDRISFFEKDIEGNDDRP